MNQVAGVELSAAQRYLSDYLVGANAALTQNTSPPAHANPLDPS